MSTVNIKLYDLFRKELKLSDEVAREFVATIAEEAAQDKTDIATKDFVKKEISESKNDLIKWMFAFWVGQIAVIAGILMYFLKKP